MVPAPLSPLGRAPEFAFKQHLNSSLYILDCLGNVLIQAENLGQLLIRTVFAERSWQPRQRVTSWGARGGGRGRDVAVSSLV